MKQIKQKKYAISILTCQRNRVLIDFEQKKRKKERELVCDSSNISAYVRTTAELYHKNIENNIK